MAQKSGHYEQRIQTGCLLILTALGIAGAMYAFSSVLIPFVLSIFLTLCLTPAIDVQMKWLRIPRRTAILTTVLAGCAILALGALLVTAAANQIRTSKDDYEQQFQQLLVRTRGLLPPDWYTDDPVVPDLLRDNLGYNRDVSGRTYHSRRQDTPPKVRLHPCYCRSDRGQNRRADEKIG